jgi:dihydrofolate synthase/folylpolyglutamate synthase
MLVGKFVTVFGVMKDKEYRAMIREIGAVSRVTVAVQPETERALGSHAITEEFHAIGCKAIDGGQVAEGLAIAKSEARPNEPILVLGSHYVAGEALSAMGEERDIFD